jgi:hypothetical protein
VLLVIALYNLGAEYEHLQELPQALSVYRKALALARAMPQAGAALVASLATAHDDVRAALLRRHARLQRESLRALPSPFEARQLQVRVLQGVSTRWQDRTQSLPALIEVMARQWQARPGKYLAFFSSFDYLRQASEALRAGYPLLPQWQALHGQGALDLELLTTIQLSGWQGPVGAGAGAPLKVISTRRFCGSRTPSAVSTNGRPSPNASVPIASAGTPLPAR